MPVNMPVLKRHRSGIFYIHWTSEGRSRRISTKTGVVRAALHFYAKWILENIEPKEKPASDEELWRRAAKALGRL